MKEKIKTDLSRKVVDAFLRGACMNCVAIVFELQPGTVERIVREWGKK